MEEGSIGARTSGDELFWLMFETSPIPMCITRESDGAYLAVNDAFHRITGFATSDVEGKTSFEAGWVAPEAREALVEALRAGSGIAQLEGHFVDALAGPRVAAFSAQRDGYPATPEPVWSKRSQRRAKGSKLRSSSTRSRCRPGSGISRRASYPCWGTSCSRS